MNKETNNYDNFFIDVKNFTEESLNKKCPDYPSLPMNDAQCFFIIKMVLSECYELLEANNNNKKFIEKKIIEITNDVIIEKSKIDYNLNNMTEEKIISNNDNQSHNTKNNVGSYNSSDNLLNERELLVNPTKFATIIAEQADAAADIIYYLANAYAKIGVNLGRVLKEVHKANMNKRFESDGKFHRNEEGKVIKPKEWKEPDIKKCIEEQIKNKSF